MAGNPPGRDVGYPGTEVPVGPVLYIPIEREPGVSGTGGPMGTKPGGSWPSGKMIGAVLLEGGCEGMEGATECPREFAAGLSGGSGTGLSASAGLRYFEAVSSASLELLDWGRD